jgi:lipopolysaccharide/colanic/teichoic acid biosynthesis glycosyltransferase
MEQGVRLGEVKLREVSRRGAVDSDSPRTEVIEFRPHAHTVRLHGGSPHFNPSTFSIAAPTRTVEILIRLLDIVGSLCILVCTLPFMLAAAVAIKLTSRGSALYCQERVGKGGALFSLYKFRTMIDDAEKHVGPVLASRDDDRVTSVGRVLRRTRLDELPQLYNILRGDMSLVGPRPERPFFVQRHKALQGVRLVVKPGLTGLAQIRSFYDLKPAHKVKYDYIYIQKRSLLLNIYILLQTVPVLFAKKGW